MSPQKTVGVFALQGDVREHVHVLEALGARTRPVRRPADLEGLDGIVLPGGESSVMDRLARIMGLKDPLIADLGWRAALAADEGFAGGLNAHDGVLTLPSVATAVADELGLDPRKDVRVTSEVLAEA